MESLSVAKESGGGQARGRGVPAWRPGEITEVCGSGAWVISETRDGGDAGAVGYLPRREHGASPRRENVTQRSWRAAPKSHPSPSTSEYAVSGVWFLWV